MLCLLLLLNELSFEGDFHSSEKKMYRKKVKGEITSHFPSVDVLNHYVII
jgi:hypothetical protein